MIFKNNKIILVFLLLIGMTSVSFSSSNMTGVYWGAFNPPTEAHAAIIVAALKDVPLKKLIIVVNNHSYKEYSYPLETRLEMVREIISSNNLENVELLWQDDACKLDFLSLRKMTSDPLCAIAGYDAYQSWAHYSTSQERSLYDAIAVVPRGDEAPVLLDERAFILPISEVYKYVSSTKLRE